MREITINQNDGGQRLDKFLTKFMPKMPKGMLYKGLRKNCVKINGKHIKTGEYMLKANDVLNLYFKDEFFSDEVEEFKPVKANLKVGYEDENILLIDKPIGAVVHTDDNGTENTLIERVKSYLYEKGEYTPQSEHSFSPAFCNRLDRNTGGIIIAAKNAAALREMNEKIKNREIKKFYMCIVEGRMQGSGIIEGYLLRHEKKVSVSDTSLPDSKYVKTGYKVIANGNKETLVEAELFTGRTHQIRASFSHIGHPLCGDSKYGSKIKCNYKLYSYKLQFDFTPNGGVLDYLCNAKFSCDVEFSKKFSSQKR